MRGRGGGLWPCLWEFCKQRCFHDYLLVYKAMKNTSVCMIPSSLLTLHFALSFVDCMLHVANQHYYCLCIEVFEKGS